MLATSDTDCVLDEYGDCVAHTLGRHDDESECGSCGGDLFPSKTFPWHWPDEDCRAIRRPK